MFYLTTHSTHFIYGYMASDIWLRTILIVGKETRCRHIGYSFRLTARVLLYAPSHRQDNTYHGLCYTSRGALAGTRNSSMGPPHEGSIRRPITPWANALPLNYVPLFHLLIYSFIHSFVRSRNGKIVFSLNIANTQERMSTYYAELDYIFNQIQDEVRRTGVSKIAVSFIVQPSNVKLHLDLLLPTVTKIHIYHSKV